MIGARLAARFSAFAAREGEALVVRRRHTLKTQRQGKPTDVLLVDGAHLAGASTLRLRADLLQGSLWQGCAVTVGANVYTVAADALAVDGSIACAVSPVLAGSLADGAAATVTTPYADASFSGLRGVDERDTLDTGERQARRVFNLVPHATAAAPAPGDLLVVDGEAKRIGQVDPVFTGPLVTRYDVRLGGA